MSGRHLVLTLCLTLLVWTPTAGAAQKVVPFCAITSLRASTTIEGCAGTLCGNIIYTNKGHQVCKLSGYPYISLWNRHARLPVHIGSMTPRIAMQLYGYPIKPVVLRPRDQALTLFGWGHWCAKPLYAPLLLHISLPRQRGELVINSGSMDPHQIVSPPCYGDPAQPGGATTGPFMHYPLYVPPPQYG